MNEETVKSTVDLFISELSNLDRNAIEGLLAVESRGVTGFLKKQVLKFLARAPENINRFQTEINELNFAHAKESAHKLAGYAGMIGAASVRLLSLAIESEINAGNNTKAAELSRAMTDTWQNTVMDFEKFLKRLENLPPGSE